MQLVIKLEQNRVTLELLCPDAKQVRVAKRLSSYNAHQSEGVDAETKKYYHDLSNVLITSVDNLMKRNNIDSKSLKSYKISSKLGPDSTSYKIAEAFMKALEIRG